LDLRRIPGFDLDRSGARPKRYAFWGDSHIAAGPMMDQLVQGIKAAGDTIGPRFLPPTMGLPNVRLSLLRDFCIGDAWSTELAYRASGPIKTGPALGNRTAPGGPDSYLWMDLRNSNLQPQVRKVTIVYQPTDAETALAISVNDGPPELVPLARAGTEGPGNSFLTVKSQAMISTVKIRVASGRVSLSGFIIDYEKPPSVTVDVFGLPSSTAQGWANADPRIIAQSLHGVTYDGIALEYGTNEGNGAHFTVENYRNDLIRSLDNVRMAFPKASCVLIGPPDRGMPTNHARKGDQLDFLKYGRIHKQIAQVQAEMAKTYDCAFWDWQAYMGGPGSNYSWANASPVLMGHDLTHLTSDGYRRTGWAIAASLGWRTELFPTQGTQ
jgi:hypothetical protein